MFCKGVWGGDVPGGRGAGGLSIFFLNAKVLTRFGVCAEHCGAFKGLTEAFHVYSRSYKPTFQAGVGCRITVDR